MTRRPLRFENPAAIMPEVDRLLAGSHQARGNWSLAQICSHLARTIEYSIEGFPHPGASWFKRRFVGPSQFRRLIQAQHMPDGIPLHPSRVPANDLDSRAEAEGLRGTLQYYGQYQGPMAEHPRFGRLTRSQWDQLHALHAAHHLSLVEPT